MPAEEPPSTYLLLASPEPELEMQEEPGAAPPPRPETRRPPAPEPGTPSAGLALGGGVTLVLPVERLAPADREGLLRAAAPLLDALRERGIVSPAGETAEDKRTNDKR